MTPSNVAYKRIIEEVAKKHGVEPRLVDKVYKAYWGFIRETLSSLPLKEDLTEEQFKSLRASINVPSLGKFYCDYDRLTVIKNRIKYLKSLKENAGNQENQTAVQRSSND